MNRFLFQPSNRVMGSKKLSLFLLMLSILFFHSPLGAQLFQWTDNRGVIHFTDNLHSAPASLRASPLLIIREDIDIRGVNSSEPVWAPDVPEVVSSPEPEPPKVAPPVIHYSPQDIAIVVINNIVRRPRDRFCLVECPRPVPRFNFEDRRYIHPSVFNGGSRQYIQAK